MAKQITIWECEYCGSRLEDEGDELKCAKCGQKICEICSVVVEGGKTVCEDCEKG